MIPLRIIYSFPDPLLVLVNDRVPLPENWQVIPRMIDDEQVDLKMYGDLTAMFEAAGKEEVWFWVASGYRSVEEQTVILDRAVQENLDAGMEEKSAREEAPENDSASRLQRTSHRPCGGPGTMSATILKRRQLIAGFLNTRQNTGFCAEV